MRTITEHNYEVFLIDQLDGKLDPDTLQELKAFLLLHPNIQEEFEQLESTVLQHDAMPFEEKISLKIPDFNSRITPENVAHFIIAYHENDLNKKQVDELNEFLRLHVSAHKAFKVYARTFLPKENIVFEHKYELYHTTKVFAISWWRWAAAAVLLLTVGISVLIFTNRTPQLIEQVEKEKPSILSPANMRIPPVVILETKKVEKNISRKKAVQIVRKELLPYIPSQEIESNNIAMLSVIMKKHKEVEMPLSVMFEEPVATESTPHLTMKEMGIRSIKQVADEATIHLGMKNEKHLHWTDVAGYVLAKINERTGTHLMIEKSTDENGNTYAYGLTGKAFEIEKK
jgi:hypothetical protein